MAEGRKFNTSFLGGEVSDRFMARVDSPLYDKTLRKLENIIIHPTGGLDFDPGTVFICEAKTNTDPVRLIPFEKSSSEKYVLELTEAACRFYRDKARILDGANPLEIVTPWLGADLAGLQAAQQENKLYLANPSYQISKLRYQTLLGWVLSNADQQKLFAVAGAAIPRVMIYSYEAGFFERKSDPLGGLPSLNARGVAFSPTDNYVGFANESSPYATIYKRDGNDWGKIANPGTLPTGIGRGCSFSPDGSHFAVAHDATPFITIYKIESGDVFTKLGNPATLPTGNAVHCAYSPDGTYLAVTAATNGPNVYKRSGDSYVFLWRFSTGISSYKCAWSPDGKYLAVTYNTTAPAFRLWKREGDTFALVPNPATMPASADGCAFSANGTFFAVTLEATPFVYIYKRQGDHFTKLANPGTLPAGFATGCAFSPGGDYFAVAHATNPYITIYSIAGDVFSKITNPDTLPTGQAFECAFSNEGWAGVHWGSNYPKALTFHDQRLLIGRDGIVRGSRSGSPQDFALDAADASAGFEYSLASDVLEEIVWMRTKAHNVVVGTTLGEWLLTGGDAPITGSNVFADRVSGNGSAEICAVLANASLLYVQKGGQRLLEFLYSQERGGYVSPDLTLFADHIGELGFQELAWQRSPSSMLWTRLGTGELASLTLDRNNGIVAWGRHPRDGIIKSMAIVSGDASNGEDTIYLCVQRVINGVTKQYIEYMTPQRRPADEKDCHFVDCGKIYDYSATQDTMEGATKANPVVVSATGHPFVNDEFVRITGVGGMTQLNGNVYMVKNKAANTFELYLTDGVTPLDGTGFGVWTAGGLVEKVVNALTGLGHLEGKTVAVYADGVELKQQVVSSGVIPLTTGVPSHSMIDRGDCESATPPMVSGETVPILFNATWARDAAEAHGGASSYKFTKTIAAGTQAYVTFYAAAGMHGFLPGQTVTQEIWVKIPSGGALGSEVVAYLGDKVGTYQYSTAPAQNLYDQWQKITLTRTLRAGATEFITQINLISTAALNEYFNVDDIEIDSDVVYAAKIHVGLPYTGKMWTQRLGHFSPVRIPEALLLLSKSRGGKIGSDEASLKAIRYDTVDLKTGAQRVAIGGRFSEEGSIMIVQDQPLPMSILGIVGKLNVGE